VSGEILEILVAHLVQDRGGDLSLSHVGVHQHKLGLGLGARKRGQYEGLAIGCVPDGMLKSVGIEIAGHYVEAGPRLSVEHGHDAVTSLDARHRHRDDLGARLVRDFSRLYAIRRDSP
jgi:hypothetical protein